MRRYHTFEPIFAEDSRILILGSFPSVRSRAEGFYYGHPRNRFWQVLARLYGEPLPGSITEKRELLLSHGLALWDVCSSCEIEGSSDSSIQNVVANDISPILEAAELEAVFTNGSTADRLYRRYQLPKSGIPAAPLPSTSPANAKMSLDALVDAWSVILRHDRPFHII